MRRTSLLREFAELESVWYRADGCRIHARVSRGTSPNPMPVVLVHGLGVSSRYMVPAAVRLGEFYKVYAPDLPGFGRSEKPRDILSIGQLADALAAFMHAAGLERAALIGNSMGCQIIADLAARRPERGARVVLLGPSMDPHARTAVSQILRLLRDLPRERISGILLALLDYLQCGPRRLWRTFQYALDDPIEEKLPRVQCPTLVVRGTRDPIVPESWAEEAARLLPRGQLVHLADATHIAHYTTPDQFVGVVRAFLEES